MNKNLIPQNYGSLGKELKISPKTNVAIYTDNHNSWIELEVYIGEEHKVEIKMSSEAWIALRNGEKVRNISNKAFIKNMIR